MNHDDAPSTGLSMFFLETIHKSICFERQIFGQKGILNSMDAVARCIFCVSLVLTFAFLLSPCCWGPLLSADIAYYSCQSMHAHL